VNTNIALFNFAFCRTRLVGANLVRCMHLLCSCSHILWECRWTLTFSSPPFLLLLRGYLAVSQTSNFYFYL